MNLTHEYNEYVIGLVVTDTATNRSVNFQFDPLNPCNHPEPNYYLKHSCEGDDTAKVFSEEELQIISDYVSNLPEAKKLEAAMTAVKYSHLNEAMENLHAEQGYLNDYDILDFAEKIEWLYVIVDDSNHTYYDCFETEEEAQSELEDYTDCHIAHIPMTEYSAVCTINEMVENTTDRTEVLKAFHSETHSESKAFVIEQLAQLGLNNELEKAYFAYLIANVYNVGGFYTPQDPDGEAYYGDVNPKSYQQYATEYINNLIFHVFDKEIDISKLI